MIARRIYAEASLGFLTCLGMLQALVYFPHLFLS
jgi:hypothetical protein